MFVVDVHGYSVPDPRRVCWQVSDMFVSNSSVRDLRACTPRDIVVSEHSQ